MAQQRVSKAERREAAREQARLADEKRKRQERLRRWLIPSGVTLVVIAIVAVVLIVIANSAPAPQTAAGPRNMVSDGILFTGAGGTPVATATGAVPAKGTPSPHPSDVGGDVPHVIEYIDFACPFCKQFETTNAAKIQSMVAAGTATLEVRPVAILDRSFEGTRYASRADNAGACVANFSPDDFLAVMNAFYAQQPEENTAGLTTTQIRTLVRGAGVSSSDVDRCISGETFRSWVSAATARFLADPAVQTSNGVGTPTVFVNGKMYTGGVTDAAAFQKALDAAS